MARRKKPFQKKAEEVQEYEGLKIGQTVFCRKHKTGAPSKGEIVYFYPKSKAFTFLYAATGKYHLALVQDVVENPDRKFIDKVNASIAKANAEK